MQRQTACSAATKPKGRCRPTETARPPWPAPATPQCRPKIHHRSSAILHRLDAAMAASGVRESPVLRSTAPAALYSALPSSSPAVMRRYVTPVGNSSAGSCSRRSSGSASAAPSAASTADPASSRVVNVPSSLRSSSYFFAPQYCDTMTLTPVAKPPSSKNRQALILPVLPTAASASAPRARPTMAVSTTLYSWLNRLPTSSGSAKEKMTVSGLPWTMSTWERKILPVMRISLPLPLLGAVHVKPRRAHLHIAAALHTGPGVQGIACLAAGQPGGVFRVRCALFGGQCGTVAHHTLVVVILVRHFL